MQRINCYWFSYWKVFLCDTLEINCCLAEFIVGITNKDILAFSVIARHSNAIGVDVLKDKDMFMVHSIRANAGLLIQGA